MNSLNYLLQTNLYLILFMGFYTLVLRNETFFRQNRIFLNVSIILSFVIPFINSPWFRELFITQRIRESAIMPTQYIYDTVMVGVNEEAAAWSMADLLIWIYIGGAAIFFLRFLVKLILLRSNLKVEKGSAFSFFNQLVVDRELPDAETIIDHEKVHMREWHSADIILTEIAAILNWFNPIVYLYKKEIRHIHEFIADEEAADLMHSKSNYALLLFSNTMGVDPNLLSNNFFNKSLLKRRIIMLYKNKSRSTGLWKYGFSAPLFAIMLIVSAAAASSENNALSIDSEKIIEPLKIFSEFAIPSIPKKSSFNSDRPIPDTISSDTMLAASEKPHQTTIKKALEDHNDLKRHIATTIKYPVSARENKITGYVMVNLKVQGKKIIDVQVSKSLQHDIDNEVLGAITSFRSTIQLADDNYFLAVVYHSPELLSTEEKIPRNILNHKNFLGMVVAVVDKSGEPSIGWSKTVYMNENKNDTTKNEINIKDFTAVNPLPEFTGGQKGWSDYVRNALIYPEEAKKNQVQGRVIVSFIVMKDGSLADIKVLRGIGSGADEEALRVLKASPKWKPGMEKGEPVNVAYTMPIFFKLPEPKAN